MQPDHQREDGTAQSDLNDTQFTFPRRYIKSRVPGLLTRWQRLIMRETSTPRMKTKE